MRVPSLSVLALLLAGVCVAGGLAYASFPGAEEAKGSSASPVQAIGAARGYARLDFNGALTARSGGVVGVKKAVYPNRSRPFNTVIFGAYCFNLTLRPVVVIGSPVPDVTDAGSRAISVSTVPNPRGPLALDNNASFECPVGFRDAAVVLRTSSNRLVMSTAGLFVLFF